MATQQYNPVIRFGIHFVPLFMVAAVAWIGLQLAVWGGAHIAPGLVVAAVLAAAGTQFALYPHQTRDLRNREVVEGYEAHQAERTTARTDSPFATRRTSLHGSNAAGD